MFEEVPMWNNLSQLKFCFASSAIKVICVICAVNFCLVANSVNAQQIGEQNVESVSQQQQQQQQPPQQEQNQPNADLFSFSEREAVERLVRQWAPLVWLAPGEKFMPSAVTDFLHHVHAEKSKNPAPNRPNPSSESEPGYDHDNEKELYLLQQHQQQLSNKLTAQFLQQQNLIANRRNSDFGGSPQQNWERRNKRTYREDNLLMDYIIDMPIGENSENWFLVTNDDIDKLLDNVSSFIYGQSPNSGTVPIYAMVSTCSGGEAKQPVHQKPEYSIHASPPDSSLNDINAFEFKHNPYIPLDNKLPSNIDYFTSQDALPIKYTDRDSLPDKLDSINPVPNDIESGQRRKRELITVVLAESMDGFNENSSFVDIYNQNKTDYTIKLDNQTETEVETTTILPAVNVESNSNEWSSPIESEPVGSGLGYTSLDWTPQKYPLPSYPANPQVQKYDPSSYDFQSIKQQIEDHKKKLEKEREKQVPNIPHFHITYWMFYPYSQGKTMCSISLGPLGRLPIPLIFGICLGSRKDFGSHVGDWEHMSLFFKGRAEPDEMYVSAHDCGAFYEYDRLTGTFEFRKQETRVGILQKPVFPRTVLTSNNHPVLFAARGSHGLWTAPGKHRFVRVPRLYDINGFGIPWYTWKNTEIMYETDLTQRSSFESHWIQFQGRWGNPKSRCHPLKKIGLHFCEYSDGPTGITNRQSHFQCKRPEIN